MSRLRRLSWSAQWGLAFGVALTGLLVTFLLEHLLADNLLASSSDARSGFLAIGSIVSAALGMLALLVPLASTDGQSGLDTRRWRPGGLFWRMTASYLVATLATAFMVNYAARFNGPFGAFRDSPVVRWFAQVGSNQLNSSILFVLLAALVGTLTGILISYNLRRRLGRITRAAQAWSAGDFAAAVRDPAGDELGQLARDLDRMAEQVQTLLATRQALVVVEERNRIARELHDTVKQHVFASTLLVRAARKQLDRDPETAKRHLCDAEELAEQTQQELIALIAALRPAALADRGLATVLDEYARDWSQRTGIAVDLRVQSERSAPLEVEEALYRVAQEALANVARHSGATHAEIHLAWEDERLLLVIRDDGNGFDAADAEGKGMGLASMRERVEALSGALAIASAPGATRVEACVPLGASDARAGQIASASEPLEVSYE